MVVTGLRCLGRSVLTGLILTTASMVATGQPTRVSSRDTDRLNPVRFLEESGGRSRGVDFRRSNRLNATPTVDFRDVNRHALRNLLSDVVSEAERLQESLNGDLRRSPELRPLLSDVRRLRDTGRYVVRSLDNDRELDGLWPDIQKIDMDWQILSHQIGQSPRISRVNLGIVDRLDRLTREIEKLFELDPQLDRRELLLELTRLDSAIDSLIQELEYDSSAGNLIDDLVYDSRKLGQQTRRLEDLVLDGVEYELIVTEYTRCSNLWANLLEDLRSINNRQVRHVIRRIVDSDSRIHDLLWLDRSANHEHLRQVADALIHDVDAFFNRTPLKLLLHLKNVESILETADNFYGTVYHFQQCVADNDDDATLLECYSYVEEYGNGFVRAYAPLKSQAGRVVLREIEDGIASLRAELNLSGSVTTVDTRDLIATVASLGNLSDHLGIHVKRWLNSDQQSFDRDALQAMDQFSRRSQQLHRLLQNRPSLQELRGETAELNRTWVDLYQYLGRCRTEDRQHMVDLAREIHDALYDLQAPLEL